MPGQEASSFTTFVWKPQPHAAEWLANCLAKFISSNPDIRRLQDRLSTRTGTRLIDWIDHLAVTPDASTRQLLQDVGYQVETESAAETTLVHVAGMFPPIRALNAGASDRLAIKVDSVDDFLVAAGIADVTIVEGVTGGPLRQARVGQRDGCELWIVERHGTRAYAPPEATKTQLAAAVRHLHAFRQRSRDADGFGHAMRLIELAQHDLTTAWACDLFFRAEREYWTSRNHAARVQWDRQQALGLGWSNHDHHTFRSSRTCFHQLVACLERLGFQCRERFYAGAEAGWGAQVLEQSEASIVVFADVDLSPEEIQGDFAHTPLKPRASLGTVGLWCELHGEAFLQAGMHHLECQFDFDLVRAQLAAVGVETMAPFTNFPYLKQAFTAGEFWSVNEERLARAIAQGYISDSQADQFRRAGALGSHLEILERNDGYKGFNQTGISEIIARTDPRRAP